MSDDITTVQFLRATGAVAIASTLAPTQPWRLLFIHLHFGAANTTSEDFTATMDANEGTAYDEVIYTRDLSVGSVVDLWAVFGKGYEFEKGDELDIAYTNTDTGTYGLVVGYETL